MQFQKSYFASLYESIMDGIWHISQKHMYKVKTCKGSKFINLLICEDGGFVTIQNNQIRKTATKL